MTLFPWVYWEIPRQNLSRHALFSQIRSIAVIEFTSTRCILMCWCSEYGISRSATMVLAYVMKTEKLTLKQALEQVKERKPDIRLDCKYVFYLTSKYVPLWNAATEPDPWRSCFCVRAIERTLAFTVKHQDLKFCRNWNLPHLSQCWLCNVRPSCASNSFSIVSL